MPSSLRLAELLAPLSLVTDLGMGEPDGQALRSTLLAMRLAEATGIDEDTARGIYYTTLLRHIGCTATAHEESQRFLDDELELRSEVFRTDFARPREAMALTRATAARVSPLRRPGIVARMATAGRWGRRVQTAVCEVAASVARRLGFDEPVVGGLAEVLERWDGKGEPRKLAGEAISLTARFADLATQAASLDSALGAEAAVETVRVRGGRWFDPGLAEAFATRGTTLLEELAEADLLPAVLDAEPRPHGAVPEARLDDVLVAFADVVDLKSPFMHGHSTGVATLAEAAAVRLRLGETDRRRVRRAGLLHDLGRVGVPNGIWEKPGALTSTEWERVRLHAYHSERIVSRAPALADTASLAGMHHERADGSGYHRGVTGADAPMGARLLAAADVFQALQQERPHRAALSAQEATETLEKAGADGSLDPEAARAVCEAAGQHVKRTPSWPAGLSDREVEVVRLVARGLSNKEIAARLFISSRTAEHHVQNVYAKIGLSTRAGAAMFAMEQGLIPR